MVLQVEEADVCVSEDSTAANTEQFLKIWDGVKNNGMNYNAECTLNVDPDYVFPPGSCGQSFWRTMESIPSSEIAKLGKIFIEF